jgi:hypothetical protein
MSRDKVVGIATGYGLGDQELRVRVLIEVKNFLFSTSFRPPVQWVSEALSPGAERPGREPNHSPPASAEVKKMWIYKSTSPYSFMA